MTEDPDITFRDGPTGPRSALIDDPDIWEVIQTIDSHTGDREAAIPATAELLNLTEQQVQAAIDYRATNREEIDARITLNAQAAGHGAICRRSSRPPQQKPSGDSLPRNAAGLDIW